MDGHVEKKEDGVEEEEEEEEEEKEKEEEKEEVSVAFNFVWQSANASRYSVSSFI